MGWGLKGGGETTLYWVVGMCQNLGYTFSPKDYDYPMRRDLFIKMFCVYGILGLALH